MYLFTKKALHFFLQGRLCTYFYKGSYESLSTRDTLPLFVQVRLCNLLYKGCSATLLQCRLCNPVNIGGPAIYFTKEALQPFQPFLQGSLFRRKALKPILQGRLCDSVFNGVSYLQEKLCSLFSFIFHWVYNWI